MSVRHQARGVVLQTLFTLDTESKWDGAYADGILTDNTAAAGVGQNGFSFAKKLIDAVLAKRENLDEIIVEAAPEWPLDRIAIIDRNILRIGLAELLFSDPEDVPPKVALNEAIELAKEYGSDSSSRFVNGVLGAVYRELGEPMKDAPKRVVPEQVEEKNVEELAGAVVYATDNDIYYLALVHDVFGHWTLSKGKLLEGETAEVAVVRKVQEEIGLTVAVEDSLGENTYTVNDPEEGKKVRRANFFLAQAPFLDLRFKKDGGLDDAQWFRLTDIGNLNFYDDMLPVITRAVNVLATKRG